MRAFRATTSPFFSRTGRERRILLMSTIQKHPKVRSPEPVLGEFSGGLLGSSLVSVPLLFLGLGHSLPPVHCSQLSAVPQQEQREALSPARASAWAFQKSKPNATRARLR